MPDYIPPNPVIDLSALRGGPALEFPPPGLFSVARWSLIYFLRYRSKLSGRRIETVLLPDYMCWEVGAALREHGWKTEFYGLDENLDVREEELERLLGGSTAKAVVVTHFYGRLSRKLERVAALCRAASAPLIEDCVHLPYPHHARSVEPRGDAKSYTLRKVYPIPYGAPLILSEDQEGFARFIAESGELRSGGAGALASWSAKQAVKKLLQWSRRGYAMRYRDLSSDPLKDFARLPGAYDELLTVRNFEDAVRLRRRNYELYLSRPEIFERYGRLLRFDPARDVPYMLVVFLKPRLSAVETVSSLMERAIPAALGLALDPAVSNRLPEDHPYRRIMVLPVHQDVAPRHVQYILDALAA